MEDDIGGPQVIRYDCPTGVKEEDAVGVKGHTRGMVAEIIAMGGVSVIEANNYEQVIRALDTRGAEIGVAMVVEQKAGDKNCLRFLETVKAKCGDRVMVIGVAETIECMEQMQARRVSKIIGAPLGHMDLDGVLKAIQEYSQQ